MGDAAINCGVELAEVRRIAPRLEFRDTRWDRLHPRRLDFLSDTCRNKRDCGYNELKRHIAPTRSYRTFTTMSRTEAIDPPSKSGAAPSRSRLRGFLTRPGRQLGRVLLILAIGLLIVAGALEIWRRVSLIGLPDVGDPFDVAAFRALRIPPEQDAIALFRVAQGRLTSKPKPSSGALVLGAVVGWSEAGPELREWVAANRDVLDVFRVASERADGLVHSSFDRAGIEYDLKLGEFRWLALLEASRLEEQGDMAAAWSWYRAVLRMRVHVMRRGSMLQRFVAEGNCIGLLPRIATWAADRRTSVAMLREALDLVVSGEPKPEWDVFSLKVDYLWQMNKLGEHWGWVPQGEDEDRHVHLAGIELPPNLSWTVYATRRYLANEPERSRRVLRLAFANWLAHAEEKDARHLKPAAVALFGRGNWRLSVDFYAVGADAPAAARRLTPRGLAESLLGALDARLLLRHWPRMHYTERRDHRALVVVLAGELYRRDRGRPPPSDRALVGPYLDHLPGDGSDELKDGTAPTISE